MKKVNDASVDNDRVGMPAGYHSVKEFPGAFNQAVKPLNEVFRAPAAAMGECHKLRKGDLVR